MKGWLPCLGLAIQIVFYRDCARRHPPSVRVLMLRVLDLSRQ
jgi:hypothetical protein